MAFFQNLLGYVWVGVVFVTMLSVLVAAHELGHYLFARLFGMGVEEFAIGFGKKPLVTWMRRFYTIPLAPGESAYLETHEAEGWEPAGMSASLEGKSSADRIELVENGSERYLRERTDFTVRPIPLGGFVRIKGMLPEEDGSEIHIPGGFYSKAPWQRFIVLLAGPLFSVLAGLAILVPLFMLDGVPKIKTDTVIESISKDGPADKAGMKMGDRIVAINGQPTATFYEVVKIVRVSAGKTLDVEVEREGGRQTLKVTPELDKEPTPVLSAELEPTEELKLQAKMKAQSGMHQVRLGLGDALVAATDVPIKGAKGLLSLFTQPRQIKDNIGGPGTMVKATQMAVQNGIVQVLTLSALLSISVGLFNLLPAPPLDGGQMAIAVAEMFRGGRRLSMRVQSAVSTVGVLFVFCLILTALAVDFQRIVLDPRKAPENAQKK